MNIHRLGNHLTVTIEDEVFTISNCTDEIFKKVQENKNDVEALRHILMPEYFVKVKEYETKKAILDDYSTSKYLSSDGQSIYIKSVSELTVPQDLALAIYNAESEGDDVLVQSYINFWTLASLNPDSRARTNLFWFLNKYGMQISSSGLFVAYRNVILKEEGSVISQKFAKAITKAYTKIKFKKKRKPYNYEMINNHDGTYKCVKASKVTLYSEGNLQDLYESLGEDTAPVYTDSYSRTFTIKVGTPVVMDRSNCDPIQENTCSYGLHVAGKDWLQANYFGNISLKVLVNPADVVAVPPQDSYGKMRVCAYYPVEILDRDDNGDILNENSCDGFEDDFIDIIMYDGDINNVDEGNYSLNIPEKPELSRDKIMKRLNDIQYGKISKVENYYSTQDLVEDEDDEDEDDFYEIVNW